MISIIIPVYNGEKTIDNIIKCLMKQTFKDIEIIVVNDGSTDNTLLVLKKWKSKIRVINQENKGVSSARNRGIKEARGEYLMFFDADDECKYEMIEKIYTSADNNNADYVISGMEKKSSEKIIKYIFDDKIFIGQKQIRSKLLYFLSHGLNSPCAKLYKKKIIEINNIFFDENLPLGEDINFNLEYLLVVNSVVYLNDSSYVYLSENSRATSLYRNNYYENRVCSLKKMNETLERHNLQNPINGDLRTKAVFAEIFNLLKQQCPLTQKEKYKRIQEIKQDYTDAKIVVKGKMRLLRWIIVYFNPFMLYYSGCFLQKVMMRLPEQFRGVSV